MRSRDGDSIEKADGLGLKTAVVRLLRYVGFLTEVKDNDRSNERSGHNYEIKEEYFMNTIAAIATPFGRGGISVIRISGEQALEIAERMFEPANGKSVTSLSGGSAVYGRIMSEGRMLDDGICTVFRAPRSFTGEDTVEISCHGGILLTERVLKTAFDCGAVQAQAGEFTQRAFLNGKTDLSGAEAVIGLIDAESEEKLRLCVSHTAGVLKKRCEEIAGRLTRLISSVYVKLDYPDEDLSEVSDGDFVQSLSEIENELARTASTYRHGKAVAEGIRTAIIGKPNTGKSSLLNALAGEEKAIVTSIAGTTRDVIEEKVNFGRITLRLFDTAGIHASNDEVEQIGIARSRAKADEADMIFALFDRTRNLDNEDKEILSIALEGAKNGKSVVLILTKSDKAALFGAEELLAISGELEGAENVRVCEISAVSGEGIEELQAICDGFFCKGEISYMETAVVANARQFSCVSEAQKAVRRALDAHSLGLGADICGLDLEYALSCIGQIDGRTVTDAVVNDIFHNFCVGK